jgi:hypothetical protein
VHCSSANDIFAESPKIKVAVNKYWKDRFFTDIFLKNNVKFGLYSIKIPSKSVFEFKNIGFKDQLYDE